jgi:hypothetical protein
LFAFGSITTNCDRDTGSEMVEQEL